MLDYIIKKFFDHMEYRLIVLKHYISQDSIFAVYKERIKRRMEYWYVYLLLHKKYERITALDVMDRFYSMKFYLQRLEEKKILTLINDFIAEIASESGTPQWKIRENLERDFNIKS